jgi:hypothetical protein
MKWFNHENNHVLKPREYNKWKLLAMNLNNMLRKNTFSSNTNKAIGKKGIISTFN